MDGHCFGQSGNEKLYLGGCWVGCFDQTQAYIGGKTAGTVSSYGQYGPKDRRHMDDFNAACEPVLAAAAAAELALERRFGAAIWKGTVQDCTDALHVATRDVAPLLTVSPTSPNVLSNRAHPSASNLAREPPASQRRAAGRPP